MSQLDPVMFRQIPVIQQIIRDELWFESERRGCPVSRDDPVVREKVCEVILRIGRDLRDTLSEQIASHPGPAMLPPEQIGQDHAA